MGVFSWRLFNETDVLLKHMDPKKQVSIMNTGRVFVALSAICCSLVLFGCGYLKEESWKKQREDAQAAYAREDFVVAKTKYEDATKLALDAFGKEDPRYIDTLKRLAWVCSSKGDYALSRSLYQRVYRLSTDDVSKLKSGQTLLAYLPGSIELDKDSAARSIRGMKIACQFIEDLTGSTNPELVPIRHAMALANEAVGKFPDAETQILHCMSNYRETEGDPSVGFAHAQRWAGELYKNWAWYREPDETKAEFEKRNAEYLKKSHAHYQDAIAMYRQFLNERPDVVQKLIDETTNEESLVEQKPDHKVKPKEAIDIPKL
jgi:tetratricopeptide (TPR) repeat protein